MAELIAEDGSVTMKFKMINGVLDTPKTTEQFVSLKYIRFEANQKSPAGRIFMSHQRDILRETVFRLQQVIDGFSDIHMTIHSERPNKDDNSKSDVTHTEYSLTMTKSVERT